MIIIRLTEFDHIGTDILQASIDLLSDELGWDDEDVLNAESVLGCQARCGSESIAAMGGENSLISFQAPSVSLADVLSFKWIHGRHDAALEVPT